jgi:hypothetical protein
MRIRDYLTIGSAPAEEECAKVGESDYGNRARKECRAYIRQLRREFGNEPEGASLVTRFFPHDFGTYLEVVCYYEDDVPESVEYAYRLERESPANWDTQAVTELGIVRS